MQLKDAAASKVKTHLKDIEKQYNEFKDRDNTESRRVSTLLSALLNEMKKTVALLETGTPDVSKSSLAPPKKKEKPVQTATQEKEPAKSQTK